MALFRKVQVTLWADYFIQSLTDEQKLFWIYLLTNPATNLLGIYEINLKMAAFHLNKTEEKILEMIDFFESKNKVKFSQESSEIAIKNWQKHNKNDSVKTLKNVENDLLNVKNRSLIEWIHAI
ncbi:MAG TPA: hypothetical protein VMU29_12100 [Smithella sp.]|nr:hypothetical protein [Smithella sp.]